MDKIELIICMSMLFNAFYFVVIFELINYKIGKLKEVILDVWREKRGETEQKRHTGDR